MEIILTIEPEFCMKCSNTTSFLESSAKLKTLFNKDPNCLELWMKFKLLRESDKISYDVN